MADFNLRDPSPNWERIKKTVGHEEPDRVPLLEALVEYPVQSRFLGREVTADDIKSQVEFYYKAGYDAVPITVSAMAFGKVDDSSPISKGTPKEVEERVKELLKNMAPGGGYCLSAGNSVTEWGKFENYIAMLKTAEKYGKYPISL